MIPAQLSEWTKQLEQECMRKAKHEKLLTFRNKVTQSKYIEPSVMVISEQTLTLQNGAQLLGQHHCVVSALRFNLIHIYDTFRKFDLAKKHSEDLLASEQESLGMF